MILICVWLIMALGTIGSEKIRYDNYTLFKIQPRTERHLKFLQNIEKSGDFTFWNEPVSFDRFVNVITKPESRMDFELLMKLNDIDSEATIDNIQESIENENVKSTRNVRSMEWDAYYPLERINQWLDDLAAAYPNIVTPLIAGTSFEGRQIRGIKMSYGSGRRAIFLEGGIHSIEWISPATVTYIINELLRSPDAGTRSAANTYDWYIFPVTNPDGYAYTFETNRFWRKNRRPVGNQIGVDLNRNWNNNWLVAGADSDPSSELYAGPGPFSEIETRTLSAFISSVAGQLDMYLSFHSYLQLLMVPFGNTTDRLDNYWDAVTIARRAVGSLAVRHGTQYVVGNIAETIYYGSGGSVDWVKGTHQVPLVFVYELRDQGQHGFLLPAEQIIPTGEETMDSLLALIREAKFLGYMNASSKFSSSFMFLSVFVGILFIMK